jgi:hypothetical protein
VAEAPADGLGAIAHPDLLVGIAEAAAHRVIAQAEAGRDLAAVEAQAQLAQHLPLPIAQGLERPGGTGGGLRVHHAQGELRIDHPPAPGREEDGVEQQPVAHGSLAAETLHPGIAESPQAVGINPVLEHQHHPQLLGRKALPQRSDQIEDAAFGQVVTGHQHQLGVLGYGQGQELGNRGGLPAGVLVAPGEDGAQGPAGGADPEGPALEQRGEPGDGLRIRGLDELHGAGARGDAAVLTTAVPGSQQGPRNRTVMFDRVAGQCPDRWFTRQRKKGCDDLSIPCCTLGAARLGV